MENILYEEIRKMKDCGFSLRKIAKSLNRSTETIRPYLVASGHLPELPSNFGGRKRKYIVNDLFFENIDSEEKAYVLGFLCADGCVHEKRNQISITLKESDEKHIININNILGSNFPILRYSSRYSNGFKLTNKSKLQITSKKMVQDLQNVGCVARKSNTLSFPCIQEKYVNHFMRGYFDGDGSIFITSQNSVRFGVISTKEFCETFLSILPYSGKSKVTKEKRSNKNVYYIQIGGFNYVKLIYEFLYRDATIFLDRKRDIFIEVFGPL